MRDPDNYYLSSEITNWKSRSIALATTFSGIVGAGLSTLITISWIQNTALALTTTLISTGALSLLFDIALRRNVYQEMIRLVGINRSVIEQHFFMGGPSNNIDWPQLLNSKSEINLLLVDPNSWIDQHLSRILENGRRQRVSITFLLPDPTALYIDELANSLGVGKETLERTINEALNRIERSWNALKNENSIVSQSELTIRFLEKRPLYSIVLSDDVTVITMTGVSGRIGADADYSYVHRGDRSSFPSSWFRSQLKRMDELPIRFQNKV
ncbi:hypothetical protein [Methylobacterium indicum]|uniref:hypothetical protein n=1 Tax=Methylobacterium indicum TaxID=1775910 RepID=UPI000AF4F9A1|nr:hypothetical protein [Methylobacterium indicum]